MPLKNCNCCKLDKPLEEFYANKRMKDGRNTFCVLCHKADNKKRKAESRSNPDFKAAEMVYKKIYREKTSEQRSAYMAQWRIDNQEWVKKYSKTYREQNKARYNYLCQKRKIDLLKRTPAWLTQDDLWIIEQAYELAALRTRMLGVVFHVDHVLPLRGNTVCGLHVPQNIRVVTWLENQSKSNKHEV
jgi:hypothetical protein